MNLRGRLSRIESSMLTMQTVRRSHSGLADWTQRFSNASAEHAELLERINAWVTLHYSEHMKCENIKQMLVFLVPRDPCAAWETLPTEQFELLADLVLAVNRHSRQTGDLWPVWGCGLISDDPRRFDGEAEAAEALDRELAELRCDAATASA